MRATARVARGADGHGKTAAAILGWLWRRRCHPKETVRNATPRRLVYCLPMRVLVEQTRACAVRWLNNLGLLAGKATFDGDRLEGYEVDWKQQDKIAVVRLMGGESQRDWREYPEREAIIIGTQDMLLSRALNRGFAMPPQEWPIDFGFLNVDALWVMDEVQLMGPGRTTSVQLQAFWDAAPPSHGLRQTLWMSATLGSQAGSLQLPNWMQTPEKSQLLACQHTNADLQNPAFALRWNAPKRLELHLDSAANNTGVTKPKVKPARGKRKPGSKDDAQAGKPGEQGWTVESPDLHTAILDEANGGRLVLVFVNQVKRARELHDRLRASAGAGAEVLLVHARMRPRDRHAVVSKLGTATPASGRIVVTTQVLEAGVDLDADALFTELCPWPSLVQRFGRLNRSGTRPRSSDVNKGKAKPARAVVFEFVVFEPPQPTRDKESSADYEVRPSWPYEPEAIDEARKLLAQVAEAHDGSLSPKTLSTLSISLPLEGPVLRRFDLDDLFDTDPDLSGGHTDVTPYLRAADRDVDAYLLWRRIKGGLNVRIKGGLNVDKQVPIHRDELCPVPFYEAQEAFAEREVWILTLSTGRKGRAAWRKATGREIRAGDTVMVNREAGCYREDAGWTGEAKDIPSRVVDRWEKNGGQLVRAWVEIGGAGKPFFDEIDAHIVGPRGRLEDHRCFTRQWMELQDHLCRARQKASRLVAKLSLNNTVGASVIRAAHWHDVGKALERDRNGTSTRPFQEYLRRGGTTVGGHPRPDALYAKSNGRKAGETSGFRHEMASLLAFLQSKHADDDLAAFLILAHHGKVRLLPEAWDDDDPVDLCGVRKGDRIPAAALPVGNNPIVLNTKIVLPSRQHRGWQGRVHKLLKQHGPFLLAYLEGLVRVADWRAS
ncbi:helicase-related protein [Chloracidobacterium aggregatum]|uniref:type I-G CRISPR-associated helicase/endonuclease Cas3g n=1 Tax=Chloracidobacterium aggregatum TaxID=2851959 RepID=UPI003211A905